MAKVRKFNLDVPKPEPEGQGGKAPPKAPARNAVPDISREAVDSVTASAPVRIRDAAARQGPGNPRKRRYKQKTYSLLQEDIERIETLVAAVRAAGLYDRSRSDIVRAGVALLQSLPPDEQVKAVQAVENLRSG